jgi:hypothetical protein
MPVFRGLIIAKTKKSVSNTNETGSEVAKWVRRRIIHDKSGGGGDVDERDDCDWLL